VGEPAAAVPSEQGKNRETADYAVGKGKPPPETRFGKGESGNPSGRPKGIARLTRELFGGNLDETIVQFWAGVMAGGALPDGRKPTVKESLEASKLLANYGWGKPAEFVPIEDADPLGLSDATARSMTETLYKRADELAARRRKREADQAEREADAGG
jgi:uncharacterized protein DUF5681